MMERSVSSVCEDKKMFRVSSFLLGSSLGVGYLT